MILGWGEYSGDQARRRMEVYGEPENPEGEGKRVCEQAAEGGGDVCFPLKTDLRGVMGRKK